MASSDGPADDSSGEPPVGDDGSADDVTDQWHSEPPENWSEDDDGTVFGPTADEPEPIEPGDPKLENALLVLLGALTAVVLLLQVAGGF